MTKKQTKSKPISPAQRREKKLHEQKKILIAENNELAAKVVIFMDEIASVKRSRIKEREERIKEREERIKEREERTKEQRDLSNLELAVKARDNKIADLEHRINILDTSVEDIKETYSLITANLRYPTLMHLCPHIATHDNKYRCITKSRSHCSSTSTSFRYDTN